MGEALTQIVNAQLDVGLGKPVLYREVVGNVFGLASAIGGAHRKVWAWPVGIMGNLVLFTVFLGAVFHTPQNLDMWGQAGRQVFFLITSAYGWIVWAGTRRGNVTSKVGVFPRWATRSERVVAGGAALIMLGVCHVVLRALGSWGPLADSWILTGSILATFGMARGWNEFWFVWIAVDVVGVPLLLAAQYYPSAIMYIFYGLFCLYGFLLWRRTQREQSRKTDLAARSHVPGETSGPRQAH